MTAASARTGRDRARTPHRPVMAIFKRAPPPRVRVSQPVTLRLCSRALLNGVQHDHPGHRRDRLRRLRRRPRPGARAATRCGCWPVPASDRRNLAGLDAEIVTGDLTDPDSLARAAAGCRFVVPCRRRLSRLGARSGGDAAGQCRRRRGDDAAAAGGGRRADRPLQFRRRARPDRRRHAGR